MNHITHTLGALAFVLGPALIENKLIPRLEALLQSLI